MWFFNKNKKQEETKKDMMDVEFVENEISKEDKDKAKAIANRFFPNNYKTLQGQQMVLELLNGLVDVEVIENKSEAAWKKACASKNTEDLVQVTIANATHVDDYLSTLDFKEITKRLNDADFDTLLQYYIALDYYLFVLNNNYCMNISVMCDDIIRELKQKGLDTITVRKYTDLELLQKQAHDLEKNDPKSDAYQDAKKSLGKMLLEQDALYVAFDQDFNAIYPYLALDGRIEVTTSKERAEALKNHYSEKQLGTLMIKEVKNEEITNFFLFCLSLGIHAMRLDNGFLPVNIFFYDFMTYQEKNIMEIYNRSMRAQFIHLLQMSYRLRKLDQSADVALRKKMTEILLTAKANGYRNLGNGLVYVISKASKDSNDIFFTSNALKQANAFIETKKLNPDLLKINDQEVSIFNEPLALRLINQKKDNQLTSYLCAYTNYEEALKVKQQMKIKDACDQIVVVTYDELMFHANKCGGILVDMLAYGLQIPARDYHEIIKWKNIKGPIMIKLKDQGE